MLHQPKITLPTFDGSNSLDWIFQAENFFSYYEIPEEERVELVVFYLVGNALSWYKNQADNALLGTWTAFKRAIELRFGPSTFENHEATLFKLKQTSTVAAYQTEFERISNRVIGLSPQALKNCFISGLRYDIQNELAIHKPVNLQQACGLARLVEEKLTHSSRPKSTYAPRNPTFSSPSTSITAITNPPPSSLPPLLPTPNPTPPLPFTRLSPEALMQRRKEGLCFKCPEKFTRGHKCSPPQFLLIVDNEEPDDDTTDLSQELPQPELINQPSLLCLSDAAFFGIASPQTLRVTGHIRGKPVSILVDCGSTHNIIQPRIAHMLHLETKPITPFEVMVGNGQNISCHGYCPDVDIEVQKAPFHLPFFVIPVAGADVILRIG